MPPTITTEDVLALRLARQHLSERAPRRRLTAVVRDLVGVQAQLPSAAALSLWARVEGLAADDVDRALWRTRRLTRTWCLRGTAHLIAREDHAFVTRATARAGGIGRALQRQGLGGARLERLRRLVLAELAEGPRTRAELRAAVTARAPGLDAFINSWGGVIRLFAQQGAVVFGPNHGSETTFVRADQWLGAPAGPADEDRLLGELLRRYLRTHGPASSTDFTYWSGLGGVDARRAVAAVGEEIETLRFAGRPVVHLRAELAAFGGLPSPASVRLLPHFDGYVLAYRDKSPFLPAERAAAVFRSAGWVSPTILVAGRVCGTWSHELRGRTLHVTLEPFGRLARATRAALGAEAASLARFLGAQDVRIGR